MLIYPSLWSFNSNIAIGTKLFTAYWLFIGMWHNFKTFCPSLTPIFVAVGRDEFGITRNSPGGFVHSWRDYFTTTASA